MKRQQSIFLDEKIVEAIRKKADRDFRSNSYIVNEILKRYFKIK